MGSLSPCEFVCLFFILLVALQLEKEPTALCFFSSILFFKIICINRLYYKRLIISSAFVSCIFIMANQRLPRSFRLAPMWYTLSSSRRKRSCERVRPTCETWWHWCCWLGSQRRVWHQDYRTSFYTICRQPQYIPKWNELNLHPVLHSWICCLYVLK